MKHLPAGPAIPASPVPSDGGPHAPPHPVAHARGRPDARRVFRDRVDAGVELARARTGGAAGGAACATAPTGSTATVNVTIKDFKFAPQPVQAKVGDVIQWANQDSAPHSATLDNGACDTKPISPGSNATLVFTAPGTYTYHCSVHPTQMKDYTIAVT